MGERKVQAKYYPPDFDPSQLPKIKKKRLNDDAVRFMLPMSVRCDSCGEFMGAGLKFNARKSHTGDDYLGIRIFRFTMRCKGCPAPFAILTDPKNSDYSCESGVRRNFEPWREADEADQDANDERSRQDEDKMQALENKTKDAKQQMEELDALDHIKSVNAKRARVNVDDILSRRKQQSEFLTEADERQIAEDAKLAILQRNERNRALQSQRAALEKEKVADAKLKASIPNLVLFEPAVRLKPKKVIQTSLPKADTTDSSPAPSPPAPTPIALVAYDDSSSDSEED